MHCPETIIHSSPLPVGGTNLVQSSPVIEVYVGVIPLVPLRILLYSLHSFLVGLQTEPSKIHLYS